MTLVISWFNNQNPSSSIWTASDTKISNSSMDKERLETKTLAGSKILELKVTCKNISISEPTKYQVYNISSLGFAYAGSSLAAFNTFATLSAILSNLGSYDNVYTLPDYKSLVQKAKDIMTLYSSRKDMQCEVCIFGFCPLSREAFIGHVEPIINNGQVEYAISFEKDRGCNLQYILLGDKKDEARQIIDQTLETNLGSIWYWRSPSRAMKQIGEDKNFESIGGGIQYTTVDKQEYLPCRDVLNHHFIIASNKGTSGESIQFRNMDLTEEIGLTVGNCFITMNGILLP